MDSEQLKQRKKEYCQSEFIYSLKQSMLDHTVNDATETSKGDPNTAKVNMKMLTLLFSIIIMVYNINSLMTLILG